MTAATAATITATIARRITLLRGVFSAVALLSFALVASAQSASAPSKGSAASAPSKGSAPSKPPASGRADRLSREAETQSRVSGEMTQLIQDFNELVSEVESNQAYGRADGASLDQMKRSLDNTDKSRVRVAASELNKATAAKSGSASHVKEAAVQVRHAKTELTRLLRQANALMLDETIGREVLDLLREQQDLARKTAQTARDQLQQQPLSDDPARLAQDQQQLAKRVKKLKEALQQALLEELTDEARDKLQKAQKVAEEQQIEEKEQRAVEDLDKGELAEAFEEQQQVIKSLTEIADTFANVKRGPNEAEIEALRKLLAEQTKLRKETEGMSPADFQKSASALQLEQLNLAKETPPGNPAAAAMAEAAANLEKMDQKAAVAAEMAAEAALGAALEEALGPGPGVPGAKGESGTDDKGDGDSDKDEEGRGNMGKGKKGKSKKPGPDPGKSDDPSQDDVEPSNEPPSENAEVQPALAQNQPGRVNPNPQPGERQFEKSAVEGKLPPGTASTWTPLNRRERAALSENFARELPREFREMLKVYFEELSK